MPYIKKEDRRRLLSGDFPVSTGELNYMLSLTVNEYLKEKGLSYKTISEITAALDNCKDEFYRRVAAPYEDKKIEENGDVYDSLA